MKKPTTIQIEKATRKRLKKLRITRRETYDEILNRLIDRCEDVGLKSGDYAD